MLNHPSAIFPVPSDITVLLVPGVLVPLAGFCTTFEAESREANPEADALLSINVSIIVWVFVPGLSKLE